jgi:hypothetical protein
MADPVFDQRGFLADLKSALQSSSDLTAVDDEQIYVLDRFPDSEDVVTLVAPSVLVVPGGLEKTVYGGAVARGLMEVTLFCLGETRDASDDSDNLMDSSEGALKIMQDTETAALGLGTSSDGRFALTASGQSINSVTAQQEVPQRFNTVDGGDVAIAPLMLSYWVEF